MYENGKMSHEVEPKQHRYIYLCCLRSNSRLVGTMFGVLTLFTFQGKKMNKKIIVLGIAMSVSGCGLEIPGVLKLPQGLDFKAGINAVDHVDDRRGVNVDGASTRGYQVRGGAR